MSFVIHFNLIEFNHDTRDLNSLSRDIQLATEKH